MSSLRTNVDFKCGLGVGVCVHVEKHVVCGGGRYNCTHTFERRRQLLSMPTFVETGYPLGYETNQLG